MVRHLSREKLAALIFVRYFLNKIAIWTLGKLITIKDSGGFSIYVCIFSTDFGVNGWKRKPRCHPIIPTAYVFNRTASNFKALIAHMACGWKNIDPPGVVAIELG